MAPAVCGGARPGARGARPKPQAQPPRSPHPGLTPAGRGGWSTPREGALLSGATRRREARRSFARGPKGRKRRAGQRSDLLNSAWAESPRCQAVISRRDACARGCGLRGRQSSVKDTGDAPRTRAFIAARAGLDRACGWHEAAKPFPPPQFRAGRFPGCNRRLRRRSKSHLHRARHGHFRAARGPCLGAPDSRRAPVRSGTAPGPRPRSGCR